MHNLSRRSDRRTDDWRLPAYSVEKLRQLSKQRADGSRELDSEEFSARNRNSCNLRENEIALTACSNHAGEFFNRIGRELPFRQGASRLTEAIKCPPLRNVRETPATSCKPVSASHRILRSQLSRGTHHEATSLLGHRVGRHHCRGADTDVASRALTSALREESLCPRSCWFQQVRS